MPLHKLPESLNFFLIEDWKFDSHINSTSLRSIQKLNSVMLDDNKSWWELLLFTCCCSSYAFNKCLYSRLACFKSGLPQCKDRSCQAQLRKPDYWFSMPNSFVFCNVASSIKLSNLFLTTINFLRSVYMCHRSGKSCSPEIAEKRICGISLNGDRAFFKLPVFLRIIICHRNIGYPWY